IILAAGRSTFEFGRVDFGPSILGTINPKFSTPTNALIFNTVIGIIALLTGKTGEIITIACFGALSLYTISMVSMIVLRKKHPELERPFKVPFYPASPIIALIIAVIALIAVTIYNPMLALIYFAILGVAYVWFKMIRK
ncbi:MAG: amino acid permease, partial [Cyclobacteriaceae bacterium]|nr:amino acid permease [Cyclobacteriaceae bacterium SS2]